MVSKSLIASIIVYPFSFTHTLTLVLHPCTNSSTPLPFHTLTPHTHTHTRPPCSAASQNRCSVRFIGSSRVDMRAMHFAVDQLSLDTIFPLSDGFLPTMNNPSALKKCLDELKGSELNKTQQDAITSMLDPACKQVCVCTYTF